ncbi:hypothetical protein ACQRVR_004825 [Enterobacter cloacae]|uniref:hypothetical protein n=1 Tax=Enterobacter TaxID=547 RepID=UPI000A9CA16A|nr:MULTISPECIES: hypothetical protein [Enterobacter]
MITLTKEWLMKTIAELEEERDATPGAVNEDAANALAAMKLALASLEAEPVAWLLSGGGAKNNVSFDSGNAYVDPLREVTPLYTAPPAPVSVPDAMEMDDDFDSAFEHGKAVGWNACRAAILQAGTLTNEGTIPVTQFKPVADLYGLTSPTGSETSFTFDAVEARDFIDGGWSCQEYVELERFHEAITNHTEDKLAMVDHSGDSNNMVEPVTTTYKLPFEQWLSKQTGTIDVEYGCVMTEVFFHWLRVAYDAGNSPVIADGWVLVPEEPTHEMLEAGDEQFGTYDVYRRMIAASPQQEVMP